MEFDLRMLSFVVTAAILILMIEAPRLSMLVRIIFILIVLLMAHLCSIILKI